MKIWVWFNLKWKPYKNNLKYIRQV
jgi:hypothetical protein